MKQQNWSPIDLCTFYTYITYMHIFIHCIWSHKIVHFTIVRCTNPGDIWKFPEWVFQIVSLFYFVVIHSRLRSFVHFHIIFCCDRCQPTPTQRWPQCKFIDVRSVGFTQHEKQHSNHGAHIQCFFAILFMVSSSSVCR